MSDSETNKTANNFPVVGIGASAGGLDAYQKLLSKIPADSGMAYVIVMHLSSDFQSNLSSILSKYTALPVQEIVNEIHLVPDHIYVIPQNNNLIAVDGVLKLYKRNRSDKVNKAIDIFFESLAQVHKSFAIGVLLSGTAFDGTAGLKKIREAGGATIAQDPGTTRFKSMPQSAIEADTVDFVLAPEAIPSKLIDIRNSYITSHAYSEEEHLSKDEEQILVQIIHLIFLRTGNDFGHYTQPTIRRRIARRMVILQKQTLGDYYNALRNSKEEQDLLFNDFLIPVTYFFRDEHFFESLPHLVFPELIQNIQNNTLRIWVAGCSTGEEAYSLAICLDEYLSENSLSEIRVKIFASDISEKSIAKARAAIYSSQDVQQISEARLANYFAKKDGQYHAQKVIRDMCIFAVHNFIKDPPFARIDLVSCRNVLIYFDQTLQNKALGSIHYSLKEKGFLLIGKSETTSSAENLFESIAKQEKIHVRKFSPVRYVPEAFKPAQVAEQAITEIAKVPPQTDFNKITSGILLSNYTPSSVIINEQLEIVHFHGDTSPFLSPPAGRSNFNILKMASAEISFMLQGAISKIKKDKKPIRKENLLVRDQDYSVSFEIVTIPNDECYLMILFQKNLMSETQYGQKTIKNNIDYNRIIELEKELDQMREDIKRITQEQQTALEELQTTNEELLSSGEELQALNEELEASSEELQSNNEELMCVNDELMDRQDQLVSARNYAQSIVNTMREPLIVIDKDGIIKSANPAFYKYFQTTESQTEGHCFFEIGNCQWDIAEFKDLILKIPAENKAVVDYKVDVVCPGIGKKTMMVNANPIVDSKPKGMILLALEDITELAAANEQLRSKNKELQKNNEQLQIFSAAASHDLQEPLRKIQMFSRKILDRDKSLAESTIHNLERIVFSASNMSQLIADLINYTRVNFTDKEFKKTDLNLLLKKTLSNTKETIKEKNAVVSVSSLPALTVIPHQIQQLFTNLLTNSIKYSKEGAVPEIRIETAEPSSEEIAEFVDNPDITYVKICVSDNGMGFSKDYEDRIFNPFYRLHNHNEYSGSGLGLTLVKKIVDNHHGFIKASSRINKGTKMFIYLPLQDLKN
ncbi:signal transduction histidine kinase [Flavobacterium sp. 270]|uniref:CheR family methyltransferase n=1 Tax=Flavobacterium sp. 270 TaxID=2512114 RepID=UPI0010EB4744|nr:CheR family methyltransferase [Flavobacterium sp. 270]TDW52113.1 signal transduction histidine kinase [Flavobacterium sp. 270]